MVPAHPLLPPRALDELDAEVPLRRIGAVGGESLRIAGGEPQEPVVIALAELEDAWASLRELFV